MLHTWGCKQKHFQVKLAEQVRRATIPLERFCCRQLVTIVTTELHQDLTTVDSLISAPPLSWAKGRITLAAVAIQKNTE